MTPERNFGNRVLEILSEHSGRPIEKIELDARLWRDLKIGGDTAVELLESLAEEFELNLENYRYWENFPTEGELCSTLWFVKSLFDKQRKVDDLTVERFFELIRQHLPKNPKPS